MLIKDIFSDIRPVISFEIFPPRNNTPVETIYQTLDGLKGLYPDFISVTYGAGGSTTGNTVEISSIVKKKYGIEALAHLTCITAQKEQITSVMSQLEKNSVKNILALRGDCPQDLSTCPPPEPHFRHAKDLISYIAGKNHFSVGAACYPEGHPECPDLGIDIAYLKQKVDSGVDFLLTQLFFDNELFYHFIDQARQKNIAIPVSAGIMPVVNKQQIERILSFGNITFPRKFNRIMERYGHQPEALKEAGIAYATEQIIDLLSWGIDGIHLYTMNRAEVAYKIVKNISSIRNVIKSDPYSRQA